jgi:hypothetical protein
VVDHEVFRRRFIESLNSAIHRMGLRLLSFDELGMQGNGGAGVGSSPRDRRASETRGDWSVSFSVYHGYGHSDKLSVTHGHLQSSRQGSSQRLLSRSK